MPHGTRKTFRNADEQEIGRITDIIKAIQKDYQNEIILCDIDIQKYQNMIDMFPANDNDSYKFNIEFQKSRKELYQQFIKQLDKI